MTWQGDKEAGKTGVINYKNLESAIISTLTVSEDIYTKGVMFFFKAANRNLAKTKSKNYYQEA